MNFAELSAAATRTVAHQVERLIAFLPNLGAALLLALLGWALARLVRAVAGRVASAAIERLSERAAIERGLAQGSLKSRIPWFVRETAFWLVLLTFLAAAVEQLNIPAIASPLGSLALYAPRLLSALLIGAVGLIAAGLVNHWVAAALTPVGASQARMLGRLAQVAVWAVALIMAADQAGIESAALLLVVGIVLTVSLGGVALAFAIGCGPIVGNLAASHYVAKRLAKGRIARLGEHRGAVREVTSTFVVLETERGEVLIPARRFLEETSIIEAEQP